MVKNLPFLIAMFFLLSCDFNKGNSISSEIPVPGPDKEIRDPLIINSKDWPRYFTTKEGDTWIPIATNYLPSTNNILVEDYFKKFSENGGNAMRIWISTAYLEVEDSTEGTYNPEKFARIDHLLQMAKKYNVKIKFTLHHIRSISATSADKTKWSNSTALASKFTDIDEYVKTEKGKKSYLNRVRAFAARYKNDPQIYSWELWNEMDASVDEAGWYNYTGPIIDSVKKLMPHQSVTQTLGSLHSYYADSMYNRLAEIATNDYFSIHRYLDEGTSWKQYENTKLPIDQLASDAVRKGLVMVRSNPRPVVINEIGAVQPNHAGPSKLYPIDTEGTLLHDMIFAPFFSGAAGTGSTWHWDHYIYKNNLWYHFKRFANAIEGIDPVKEKFEPVYFETGGVRCYALKGKTKTIIWCRDAAVTWQTELRDGVPASEKANLVIDANEQLGNQYTSARFYNPWSDTWTNSSVTSKLNVPAFKRSIVLVLQ